MKRVACLCTIQSDSSDTSSQVIEVFNTIRSFNHNNQITGAVVVDHCYLLMIVEGESNYLGNIIFKVRQDPRLKDFSLILNEPIDRLGFSSLCIKLNRDGAESHNKIYDKIHRLLSNNVDLKSKIDEQRLDVFLQADFISADHTFGAHNNSCATPPVKIQLSKPGETITSFSNSVVSLSAWPKPGKIKLCPELIKVCARLVGKPHRFDDLLKANIVTSESALNKHLNDLHQLGILKKHSSAVKPQLIGISGGLSSPPKPPTNDRFGTVLRNFLSAARR